MSLLHTARFWRTVLILVTIGLVWLLIRFFDSDRSLMERHELLLTWAQSGSPSEFPRDFAAADYHDQWGYSAVEVAGTAQSIRLSFPSLLIKGGRLHMVRHDDTAFITQMITVTGADEPVAEDFRFTWHKESIWPWGWKLREVTAPGLHVRRR